MSSATAFMSGELREMSASAGSSETSSAALSAMKAPTLFESWYTPVDTATAVPATTSEVPMVGIAATIAATSPIAAMAMSMMDCLRCSEATRFSTAT